MALYTVHVPDDAHDALTRADRTVLVREGFNLRAFVFGALFLLWHRLWAALAIWIVLDAGLVALWWVLRPAPGPLLGLAALMHLFAGLEGNDLRRWGLARRRFRLSDVVSGARRDEAEYAFFGRQPPDYIPPPRVAARVVPQDTAPSVIGMFPDEGRA